MLDRERVERRMKRYFGHDKLRSKQWRVINSIMNGEDTIGLLTTGYGKSVCYLLPSLLSKRIVIIISPLISLMEDQREKLDRLGIRSVALHGNNIKKRSDVFDILDNKVRIVYTSPEYILSYDGKMLMEEINERVGYFALDECHCISGWGHDFRPEYLRVSELRKRYTDIPILALTATATINVVQDIVEILKMDKFNLVRSNVDRPNISLIVKKVKNFDYEYVLMELKRIKKERCIIYVNSRNEAESISMELKSRTKKPIYMYHAGMCSKERLELQEEFSKRSNCVMVSTIAFGMGIDQIVRMVIIYGSPSSIEEYYQQIGRAGRDGKKSYSILLYKEQQYMISKSMIDKGGFSDKITIGKRKKLSNIYEYSLKLKTCRRKYLLNYFGQKVEWVKCNNCDICLEIK